MRNSDSTEKFAYMGHPNECAFSKEMWPRKSGKKVSQMSKNALELANPMARVCVCDDAFPVMHAHRLREGKRM